MNSQQYAGNESARKLDLLVIEDVEDDALMLIRHLKKSGYDLKWQRVETPDALDAALRNTPWDVVICDYNLPGIDIPTARNIVTDAGFDPPFIVVSGTIGEEKAAAVMKAGAHDLIFKTNLTRLVPVIEREMKDAAERRAKTKADQLLELERRLLENLMANIPDAIYFKDRYYRYTRLNDAELRVLKVTDPTQVLGKTPDDLLPPDRARMRRAEEEKVLASGRPLVDRVEEVPQEDGSIRWYSASKAPIRDSNGAIVGLVGITRDITKRKKAEEALAASEALFRAIVDNAPGATFITSMEGRYRAVNKVVCKWYAATPEEIIGKAASDFLDEATTKVIRKQEQRVIETKTVIEDERTIAYPDGVTRDVILQKYPILDSENRILAIGTVIVDMTEHKRMEEALRAKTRQLEVVLESMDQGIYAIDENLTCTMVNQRLADLHEFPPDLCRPGVKFEDMARFNARKGRYGPGDVEEHVKRRVALARENRHTRYEFDLKNGRIIELRSNPLPDGGFVRTATDITELKKTEGELRATSTRLRGAIDSIQEGFALFDAEDRLVAFNAQYLHLNPTAQGAFENGLTFEDTLRANVDRGAILDAVGREEEFIRERLELHRNPKGRIIRKFAGGRTYILQEARTPEGGIALSFTDITDLRDKENALRESEARFRAVLDGSSSAVSLKDASGRYLLVNKAMASWLAADPKSIAGKTVHDFMPKTEAEKITSVDRDVFSSGRPGVLKSKHLFPDGRTRDIMIHRFPIRSESGNVIAISSTLTDITEITQAEEARRRSDERLSGAIESLVEGFALFDADDRIVALNEMYRKMHPDAQRLMEAGGTFENLIRSLVARGAIVDARGREEAFIEERLNRHRNPSKTPMILRFSDGSWRMLQESRTPEGGTALSFVEITEMKQAEAEIRKLSVAFEQAPLGLVITDTEGTIEVINEAFTEITGYTAADAIGRNPRILKSERMPPRVYQGIWSAIKAGKVWRGTLINKRKDGRLYPAATIISPITATDGTITHFAGAQEDVTEIKKTEAEIRKLTSLVEQNPASVVITDTNGTIEYVNAAFSDLTGYGAEEAIGKNPRMLQSGMTLPSVYGDMWATITTGQEWRGTLFNKRKNGTTYLAGTAIFPIMDGDGVIAHYAAAQTDITERVEQQNMLKQIEKMESLGSLAGGIAHDFNNMLLPIIALTKMTLKKLPDQSEHRHRLEKVIQAATRARDLVAQILKFSRREELKQENLNINEILDETLGLLRTTLPSTVKITEIRELETGCIFADASQIGSVLLNLASNAADAMDGKPGELEFSLSRQVVGEAYTDAFKDAKPGPYARIQVRDTGYGMDEPTLKRIFEPFFTTKAVGKGTGLGLATAYGIITKHGGMIHVASEVGKGTTFNIYLPLIEDTDAARTAGPKAKIKSGAKRKNNLVSSY